MKFMKLGSKPDAFRVEGSCVRYVSSELPTDIIISVGDAKFHLHKFPLLSKSIKLHKLITSSKTTTINHEKDPLEIELIDFPGGPKAFEICAKFCYGVAVTLNPYNVVAARCASEYLEMSEEIERGNLTLKIEVFLNSSILRSWKDSIIVLQMTKQFLPTSENLKIVGRCVDAIASKTSADPTLITWSYTYNRKITAEKNNQANYPNNKTKFDCIPKDWWVEDICELDVDHYKRVMISVKSKGRMSGKIIGEALKAYAMRWLPDSVEALVSEIQSSKNKSLVETIICLLPNDKGGSTISCSFLLKLLKVAILIGADESSRNELIGSIASKLDEASVGDLLIPSRVPQTTLYDVELVQNLVDQFFKNVNGVRDGDDDDDDDGFVLGHVSWLELGKVVDGYLREIASDRNLSISSFVRLAWSIPDSARPIHDGLYGAINAYLKEHKGLTKAEKKSLCGLLDVKKLTMEASMHAAQNDQLPLRVVVQVLFFEQARSSTASARSLSRKGNETSIQTGEITNWAKAGPGNLKSVREQASEMKIEEEGEGEGEELKTGKMVIGRGGSKKKNRGSDPQLLPSRSRRIFDRIWTHVVGHGETNNNNKSSDTSGSSQSPSLAIATKKASGNRRHSIS